MPITSWGTTWPMERIRSKPPCDDEPVNLRRPRITQLAFRLLADKLGRNLAESLDIGPPVMDSKKIKRHIAIHRFNLFGLHGGVGSQRGQNRFEPVAIVLPGHSCVSSPARECCAGLIGRHGKHLVARAKLGQALHEQFVQLLRR